MVMQRYTNHIVLSYNTYFPPEIFFLQDKYEEEKSITLQMSLIRNTKRWWVLHIQSMIGKKLYGRKATNYM